ncbi:hypothetical protein Mapa_003169 [Marchantia paleacea]|nr:hypothetical protein Mapa_003169 [Marchantia paleacea]
MAAGIASVIILLVTSGMGHRESNPRRRLATGVRGRVPALFIMGDSTVDVGNNNNLITLAQATFPPYGQDFDTHEPTGRFCNGRLSVDYLGTCEPSASSQLARSTLDQLFSRMILFLDSIHVIYESLEYRVDIDDLLLVTDPDPDPPYDAATYLGLPLIPPYMLMNSTTDISKGVNFASAGSGILNDTGTIFGEYISLSQQLEQFLVVKQRLKVEFGAATASRLISGSLYYISTGSNDFINNYLLPGNPHLDIFPDEYEQLLVSSYSDHIKVRQNTK